MFDLLYYERCKSSIGRRFAWPSIRNAQLHSLIEVNMLMPIRQLSNHHSAVKIQEDAGAESFAVNTPPRSSDISFNKAGNYYYQYARCKSYVA